MPDMEVVGKHTPAVGSLDIVTGRAKYTSDLTFPGMLVGKLLYSAHPCARIIKINVSKARTLPGVVVVLTHEDIPGENSYTVYDTDQPVLVKDYVRFQGDPLVAVAAEDESAAQAALEAVEVEYEPLPGVHDPAEAIRPGARQVWPDRGNVYDHLVIECGDIIAGFKEADVILENTYTTQTVEHAFLEPEGAVAKIEADGVVVVFAGCQAPFRDRYQIARTLALPEHKVRVIVPYIGGSFGGKDEIHVQIHAALLAQATGRPVRLIRTREESIRTHVKRHPVKIRYRSGVTYDGLLTAIDVVAIGDTGPYANMGKQVMHVLATHAFGPYSIPNARIEAFTVLTNNPTCGAMRGFGMPQAHFACERQMDALAKAVGIDPLEIRIRNGLETGMRIPSGVTILEGKGMKACLKEASELSGWNNRYQGERQPTPHLRRGWGMASMLEGYGLGRNVSDNAGVVLEMALDGTVILRTGASDMGQGTHTVLAQLAAEALGVTLSSIRVVKPDTDKTVDAGSSAAARQTFVSGNAVLRAAETIRKSLLDTAAEDTEFPLDILSLRGGFLYAEGEKTSLSIANLAAKARARNRQLYSVGYYAMEYPEGTFDDDSYPNPSGFYTFGTQIAKVLVDMETGEVQVEELVVVNDIGRVLNPDGALGQSEGGASMGSGYALMEELIVVQGRTLNASLDSYLIPTAKDIPVMKIRFLENPQSGGPYGARGMAEGPVIPTAPAIVNAVSDAIGAPLNEIPITAERILAAIEHS